MLAAAIVEEVCILKKRSCKTKERKQVCMDYKVRDPEYKMIVEKNMMVTARDGIKLAVDVYRPDAEGEFPGLFTISVYGKDTQLFKTPPQEFGGALFEASIEAGDPEYFVSRGYCYVIGDYRGIGSSEGEMPGMFSKYEGEDGYDIIEWMAQQPWCNGKIGGIGTCYFGFTQLIIAETQPPHLTCIAPFELNFDDFYSRGFYTGGVLHLVWYGLYSGTHPCRMGLAPKNIVSAMEKELTPEELKRRIAEAMEDPDLKQYPYLYQILCYSYKNPIIFDMLLNPLDGEFYQKRSYGNYLDKVNIPTFVGGPFHGPFGVAETSVYNKLVNVPFKKLHMFKDMDPRPWNSHREELIQWYDYWLKGIENGALDGAKCIVEAGSGPALELDNWPPREEGLLGEKKFYLAQHEKLIPEFRVDLEIKEPDSFLQRPIYIKEERGMLSYKTAPLEEDMQVAGSPILKFYASIDCRDTTWRVDLFEGGHESPWPITKSWLRAATRKRVPEEDTPWAIKHDFTVADYPIPGEIYEYEIQLNPTAYCFKAGSSIEIVISAIDLPLDETSYDEMWHYCKAQTCLHKIYRDEEHPSVLTIPVLNK